MNATGHMVVARIAWDVMTPAARREVLDLVKVEDNPASHKPTPAKDRDQFTASTYMDDIRPTFSSNHYINQPMDVKGQPLDKDPDRPNSVTFIKDNIRILEDSSATREQKAEALRYTMHLVGDLHQPLHCATRVSPAHPEGDRGGGSFEVQWQGHSGRTSIHSIWDEAAGSFTYIQRPLRPVDKKQLQEMAERIEKSYPMKQYKIEARDVEPEHWAAEGFAIARKDAYTGIRENGIVSAAYEQKVQGIMEQEAALAGYRLGNLLNDIFQ